MNGEEYPLHWLWAEIARRFGPDQAAPLRAEFEEYRCACHKQVRLAEARRQLPELEARLWELKQAGEPETAYMLNLRWRIDHHRWVLQEAAQLQPAGRAAALDSVKRRSAPGMPRESRCPQQPSRLA